MEKQFIFTEKDVKNLNDILDSLDTKLKRLENNREKDLEEIKKLKNICKKTIHSNVLLKKEMQYKRPSAKDIKEMINKQLLRYDKSSKLDLEEILNRKINKL